jgi:plastocyanin
LAGLSLGLFASGCGGGVDSEADVVLKPSQEATAPDGGGAGGDTGTAANGGNAAAPAGGFGTLRGRFVYNGNVPPQGVLYAVGKAKANPEWCAAEQPILEQKVVIDPQSKGVANVFLWLAKMPEGGKQTAAHEADWPTVFDQKNCAFVPHAMVVRTGKPLTITSSDRVNHNVKINAFSNEDANNTLGFGDQLMHTYEEAERQPIQVNCDIHTWMTAYQLPIDHPYAAVTNEKGEFVITDLPAGEHEFKIYHESNPRLHGGRLTVTIEPGDNEQTIEVSPAELQAGLGGPRPDTKTILLSELGSRDR